MKPDRLTLSFPRHLRTTADEMAAAADAIGRNLAPSISELLTRLTIAYQHNPQRWLAAWAEISQLHTEAQATPEEQPNDL
jgi:hypothetical protein